MALATNKGGPLVFAMCTYTYNAHIGLQGSWSTYKPCNLPENIVFSLVKGIKCTAGQNTTEPKEHRVYWTMYLSVICIEEDHC